MKRKLICLILVTILLCSLFSMNVMGKTVLFSNEDGVTIFYEDFEDYEMPADLINNLMGYWRFEDDSALGSAHNDFNIIETEDGTQALYAHWIHGRLMKSDTDLIVKSPFVLGGRIMAQGDTATYHGTFIWIRSVLNPLVSQDGRLLNEYEEDIDKEVGGTGLALELYSNKIDVIIREWSEETEDGLFSNRTPIDLPEGVDLTNNFVDFLVEDDGNVIKVTFDNTLLCTIEYSEPKEGYYSKAVVKDAEGNVLNESVDATLCADDEEAALAFANRAGMFTIDEVYYIGNAAAGKNVYANKKTYTTEDDIEIGYLGAEENYWIGVYKKGTTPSNENQPIKRVDVVGMGAELLKAVDLTLEPGEYDIVLFENNEYKEVSKITVTVEEPPTPEPTDEPADETPAPSSPSDEDEDDKEGGNTLVYILVAVGVVVIAAVVVALSVIKKKKK